MSRMRFKELPGRDVGRALQDRVSFQCSDSSLPGYISPEVVRSVAAILPEEAVAAGLLAFPSGRRSRSPPTQERRSSPANSRSGGARGRPKRGQSPVPPPQAAAPDPKRIKQAVEAVLQTAKRKRAASTHYLHAPIDRPDAHAVLMPTSSILTPRVPMQDRSAPQQCRQGDPDGRRKRLNKPHVPTRDELLQHVLPPPSVSQPLPDPMSRQQANLKSTSASPHRSRAHSSPPASATPPPGHPDVAAAEVFNKVALPQRSITASTSVRRTVLHPHHHHVDHQHRRDHHAVALDQALQVGSVNGTPRQARMPTNCSPPAHRPAASHAALTPSSSRRPSATYCPAQTSAKPANDATMQTVPGVNVAECLSAEHKRARRKELEHAHREQHKAEQKRQDALHKLERAWKARSVQQALSQNLRRRVQQPSSKPHTAPEPKQTQELSASGVAATQSSPHAAPALRVVAEQDAGSDVDASARTAADAHGGDEDEEANSAADASARFIQETPRVAHTSTTAAPYHAPDVYHWTVQKKRDMLAQLRDLLHESGYTEQAPAAPHHPQRLSLPTTPPHNPESVPFSHQSLRRTQQASALQDASASVRHSACLALPCIACAAASQRAAPPESPSQNSSHVDSPAAPPANHVSSSQRTFSPPTSPLAGPAASSEHASLSNVAPQQHVASDRPVSVSTSSSFNLYPGDLVLTVAAADEDVGGMHDGWLTPASHTDASSSWSRTPDPPPSQTVADMPPAAVERLRAVQRTILRLSSVLDASTMKHSSANASPARPSSDFLTALLPSNLAAHHAVPPSMFSSPASSTRSAYRDTDHARSHFSGPNASGGEWGWDVLVDSPEQAPLSSSMSGIASIDDAFVHHRQVAALHQRRVQLAAARIQAAFRGHHVRSRLAMDMRYRTKKRDGKSYASWRLREHYGGAGAESRSHAGQRPAASASSGAKRFAWPEPHPPTSHVAPRLPLRAAVARVVHAPRSEDRDLKSVLEAAQADAYEADQLSIVNVLLRRHHSARAADYSPDTRASLHQHASAAASLVYAQIIASPFAAATSRLPPSSENPEAAASMVRAAGAAPSEAGATLARSEQVVPPSEAADSGRRSTDSSSAAATNLPHPPTVDTATTPVLETADRVTGTLRREAWTTTSSPNVSQSPEVSDPRPSTAPVHVAVGPDVVHRCGVKGTQSMGGRGSVGRSFGTGGEQEAGPLSPDSLGRKLVGEIERLEAAHEARVQAEELHAAHSSAHIRAIAERLHLTYAQHHVQRGKDAAEAARATQELGSRLEDERKQREEEQARMKAQAEQAVQEVYTRLTSLHHDDSLNAQRAAEALGQSYAQQMRDITELFGRQISELHSRERPVSRSYGVDVQTDQEPPVPADTVHPTYAADDPHWYPHAQQAQDEGQLWNGEDYGGAQHDAGQPEGVHAEYTYEDGYQHRAALPQAQLAQFADHVADDVPEDAWDVAAEEEASRGWRADASSGVVDETETGGVGIELEGDDIVDDVQGSLHYSDAHRDAGTSEDILEAVEGGSRGAWEEAEEGGVDQVDDMQSSRQDWLDSEVREDAAAPYGLHRAASNSLSADAPPESTDGAAAALGGSNGSEDMGSWGSDEVVKAASAAARKAAEQEKERERRHLELLSLRERAVNTSLHARLNQLAHPTSDTSNATPHRGSESKRALEREIAQLRLRLAAERAEIEQMRAGCKAERYRSLLQLSHHRDHIILLRRPLPTSVAQQSRPRAPPPIKPIKPMSTSPKPHHSRHPSAENRSASGVEARDAQAVKGRHRDECGSSIADEVASLAESSVKEDIPESSMGDDIADQSSIGEDVPHASSVGEDIRDGSSVAEDMAEWSRAADEISDEAAAEEYSASFVSHTHTPRPSHSFTAHHPKHPLHHAHPPLSPESGSHSELGRVKQLLAEAKRKHEAWLHSGEGDEVAKMQRRKELLIEERNAALELIATKKEVAARKKLEKELREEEERVRALLAQADAIHSDSADTPRPAVAQEPTRSQSSILSYAEEDHRSGNASVSVADSIAEFMPAASVTSSLPPATAASESIPEYGHSFEHISDDVVSSSHRPSSSASVARLASSGSSGDGRSRLGQPHNPDAHVDEYRKRVEHLKAVVESKKKEAEELKLVEEQRLQREEQRLLAELQSLDEHVKHLKTAVPRGTEARTSRRVQEHESAATADGYGDGARRGKSSQHSAHVVAKLSTSNVDEDEALHQHHKHSLHAPQDTSGFVVEDDMQRSTNDLYGGHDDIDEEVVPYGSMETAEAYVSEEAGGYGAVVDEVWDEAPDGAGDKHSYGDGYGEVQDDSQYVAGSDEFEAHMSGGVQAAGDVEREAAQVYAYAPNASGGEAACSGGMHHERDGMHHSTPPPEQVDDVGASPVASDAFEEYISSGPQSASHAVEDGIMGETAQHSGEGEGDDVVDDVASSEGGSRGRTSSGLRREPSVEDLGAGSGSRAVSQGAGSVADDFEAYTWRDASDSKSHLSDALHTRADDSDARGRSTRSEGAGIEEDLAAHGGAVSSSSNIASDVMDDADTPSAADVRDGGVSDVASEVRAMSSGGTGASGDAALVEGYSGDTDLEEHAQGNAFDPHIASHRAPHFDLAHAGSLRVGHQIDEDVQDGAALLSFEGSNVGGAVEEDGFDSADETQQRGSEREEGSGNVQHDAVDEDIQYSQHFGSSTPDDVGADGNGGEVQDEVEEGEVERLEGGYGDDGEFESDIRSESGVHPAAHTRGDAGHPGGAIQHEYAASYETGDGESGQVEDEVQGYSGVDVGAAAAAVEQVGRDGTGQGGSESRPDEPFDEYAASEGATHCKTSSGGHASSHGTKTVEDEVDSNGAEAYTKEDSDAFVAYGSIEGGSEQQSSAAGASQVSQASAVIDESAAAARTASDAFESYVGSDLEEQAGETTAVGVSSSAEPPSQDAFEDTDAFVSYASSTQHRPDPGHLSSLPAPLATSNTASVTTSSGGQYRDEQGFESYEASDGVHTSGPRTSADGSGSGGTGMQQSSSKSYHETHQDEQFESYTDSADAEKGDSTMAAVHADKGAPRTVDERHSAKSPSVDDYSDKFSEQMDGEDTARPEHEDAEGEAEESAEKGREREQTSSGGSSGENSSVCIDEVDGSSVGASEGSVHWIDDADISSERFVDTRVVDGVLAALVDDTAHAASLLMSRPSQQRASSVALRAGDVSAACMAAHVEDAQLDLWIEHEVATAVVEAVHARRRLHTAAAPLSAPARPAVLAPAVMSPAASHDAPLSSRLPSISLQSTLPAVPHLQPLIESVIAHWPAPPPATMASTQPRVCLDAISEAFEAALAESPLLVRPDPATLLVASSVLGTAPTARFPLPRPLTGANASLLAHQVQNDLTATFSPSELIADADSPALQELLAQQVLRELGKPPMMLLIEGRVQAAISDAILADLIDDTASILLSRRPH